MPLTPQEQAELDQLELAELEEEEKQYQASQAPKSESVMDRLKDPKRWKQIAGLEPSTYTDPDTGQTGEVVGGTPPIAMPAGMAPAAIGKLAQFFGKAKTTAGTVQGGLEGAMAPADDLTDRAKNAAIGAGVGLGVGAAGSLAGKVWDAGKRISGRAARMTPAQAGAYIEDPKGIADMAAQLDDPTRLPELQDRAVGAINQSRKALKGRGMADASKLKELLTGKKVDVDVKGLDGIADDIDSAIRTRNIPATEYVRPDTISLDANQANQIKRGLQRESAFKAGTVLDPVQEARNKELASRAGQLRQTLEGVDPQVAGLNKSMQEGQLLQQELRQGAKQSPLAFLSSESPDRMAKLARAEAGTVGEGMLSFGKKLGAAKSMATKDVDDALSRTIQKKVGRAGLRLSDAAGQVSDATTGPLTIDQLNELILQKSSQK